MTDIERSCDCGSQVSESIEVVPGSLGKRMAFGQKYLHCFEDCGFESIRYDDTEEAIIKWNAGTLPVLQKAMSKGF